MERISVASSNISAIGYDPSSETLEVEFNSGAVYQYTGVSQGEYDGFIGADSKGKYFAANIKNRHSFTKL